MMLEQKDHRVVAFTPFVMAGFLSLDDEIKFMLIGDLPVTFRLCFTASPGAKPYI